MENEVAVTEKAQPQLVSLSNVEKVVNEYARVLAVKARINPDHVEVFLSRNLGAIMKVNGGSVVRVFLQWPEAQPNINTLLGDAFSLMKRYPVRRTMEIVPVSYIRTQRDEIKKKWRKEKFTDESEIILDLVPRHRLRVVESHTTTLTDVVSGESITVTRTGPTDRFDGDAISLWFDLSRVVRDKHPEEDLPDDEPKETPLLEEAVESDEWLAEG